MPAVMIGMDANLHFMDRDKKETVMPAEDFFKAQAKTDKIFTHVSIKRDKKSSTAYQRVKKTVNVDIPLLSILMKTHFENKKFTNARVAVNNCVNFAQRDSKLEAFLNGKSFSSTLAQEALQHLDNTIYETRSDDYKKHMFTVSIKRAINTLGSN